MIKYPALIPNDDIASVKFIYGDVEHINNVKEGLNVQELIYSLTDKCVTMVNKIGAIFYWLALVKEFNPIFYKPSSNSEELFFKELLINLAWKPKLFEFLCRIIDVPCYTIRGIARTISSKTVSGENLARGNHTWNCVYIDKKWYLCDVMWASRVRIKTDYNPTKDIIETVLSFHYFLVAPIKLRNTHFPIRGDKYQLLSTIITIEQFDNLPIFSEHFFNSILSDSSFDTEALISDDGYIKLSISCKDDAYFIHFLEYYDEPLKQWITKFTTDEEIQGYSVLERAHDSVILYCRLPMAGVYYFTLFIQDVIESDFDCKFKALLKWKIQCRHSSPEMVSFFGCHNIMFGPNWPLLRHYGLVPVNFTNGVVRINYSPPAYIEAYFNKLNPDVTIVAKVRGDKKLLPANYQATITEDSISYMCNGQCLDWLIDEEDETDTEISITIRLPTYGEYSLEIYANNPHDGDRFVHVAQYLLDLKRNEVNFIDRNQ